MAKDWQLDAKTAPLIQCRRKTRWLTSAQPKEVTALAVGLDSHHAMENVVEFSGVDAAPRDRTEQSAIGWVGLTPAIPLTIGAG